MSYYDPDLKKQVLTQDAEQVAQSTRKARESRLKKEQADYEKAVKEYEKDAAAAEAQYQRDLAEYNKQLAESQKQNKYDAEIQRLEAAKQKEIADAHYSVWGPGGSRNRSELSTKQNTIIKNYDSKINQAIEAKRIETGYQEFSLAYPGQILPRNVAETFRSSPSFSLTGLYQTKIESKARKAEYQRQASAQSAQNISAKQSVEYHSNIPNIGFISSGLGTERGAAVKPLPDAPTGKKAVETRRPLINVKTVESIYGGQFIEANPRAFVASLDRQNVDAAGRPLKPKQTEQPISIIAPTIPEPVQNNERWQVDVDGKIRIFKTKEAADEFIQRINPPVSQGPIFQRQESVYLPAGSLEYLLSTKQLKSKISISQSEKPLGPEKPRPLESGIQFFGDLGKKYKDIQPLAFTTGAIEEGLGIIGGTINLIEKGRQKLGEFATVKYPIKQEVKKPYTLPASPIEYPLDVGYETVFGGVPLTQAERQVRQKQIQIIKDEGGYRYSGKLAVSLATIPFKGAVRTSERIASGLLKPARKEATSFLQRRTASMLDVSKTVKTSKPFSYDIPYKPTTRPNEINLSDFGERIGPATPISKKPIAARQSDVIIPKQKKIIPIKEDISYKPATRANEIRVSGIVPKENVIGKIEFSKGFIPSKVEKPLKGKITEPVKPDPLFRPARRANEIDLSRDIGLPTFETTRVRLGRGTIQPRKTEIRGKKETPVKEDFFYKPSKRANEIDLSDFGDKIKMPKIEPEKSEIGLNLKRELKRLKRKQPEFKTDKLSLGGEGVYLSGKRQSLILVKRQEQLTKKKLIIKRKTPLSINWSEQIETTKIPKTGSSPIQILVPREKKKKKAYLQEQTFAVQAYDVPLSAQRPKIKSVQRSEIRSEFKLSSPQRIQENIKFETVQPQKLSQRPKIKTRQRSIPKYEVIPIQRIAPKQIQKTTPKLASPLAPKAPTKLRAPQRQPLREKPVQVTLLRERPPRKPPRVIFALPPDKDKKQKTRKAEKSEIGFFLGNVPETQISGIFKRKEITLGKEKIQRIRTGDVRVLAGRKRTVKKETKWFEGKKGDMFGFKNESKKRKTKFF